MSWLTCAKIGCLILIAVWIGTVAWIYVVDRISRAAVIKYRELNRERITPAFNLKDWK